MQVKVAIHADTTPPVYATEGAGCFDIAVPKDQGVVILEPGCWHTFDTGLSFEVPDGWMMLIGSRSGMGFKHRVRLSNCMGFIDADYRGRLYVQLINDGDAPVSVNPGDRIAQGFLVQPPRVEFVAVAADELSETVRGANGLGSSGGFVKA